MVRALTRSIFGKNAGRSFCSMRMQRTPRWPRSIASVSPVGPAPTIRTSLSIMPRVFCYAPAAGQSPVRSLLRRFEFQLGERLVRNAGKSLRRSIDKLRRDAAQINHRLGPWLTAAVELKANHIVRGRTLRDRLKLRWGDERATEVGALRQNRREHSSDLLPVIRRVGVRINGRGLLALRSSEQALAAASAERQCGQQTNHTCAPILHCRTIEMRLHAAASFIIAKAARPFGPYGLPTDSFISKWL